MRITKASGEPFEIPMFDPVVAKHFANPSSNVGTLLSEINEREIYAGLFKGKKDLVFLDIGSNIGLVSLYAYDSCQRIVALEPAPETFKVLKSLTFPLTKIERVQAALAPEDGPCEFFQNDQNTTASSTVNTFGELTEVPGLMLSSILSIYQLEHVDVAKFDCEGGENESLPYEQLVAAADVIDCYYIEFHNAPRVTWESVRARVMEHLSRLGYRSITMSGMTMIAIK